ncbi:hypothetical protein TcasGA2_TC002982 [Tribolium castaneum]|uniref:Uncharacterized protein n=1 Tax=Tribolium castaneum TaxID=7070 RepID=D6WGL8_TRICA|nr:hypothetical protein TcasGA2_TC002982 [Tribolium castaneum]
MQDKQTNLVQAKYMTKEFLSKACTDFIEDILRKTFDEEDPISQAPLKVSQETQTFPRDFAPQVKKQKFLF